MESAEYRGWHQSPEPLISAGHKDEPDTTEDQRGKPNALKPSGRKREKGWSVPRTNGKLKPGLY